MLQQANIAAKLVNFKWQINMFKAKISFHLNNQNLILKFGYYTGIPTNLVCHWILMKGYVRNQFQHFRLSPEVGEISKIFGNVDNS